MWENPMKRRKFENLQSEIKGLWALIIQEGSVALLETLDGQDSVQKLPVAGYERSRRIDNVSWPWAVYQLSAT